MNKLLNFVLLAASTLFVFNANASELGISKVPINIDKGQSADFIVLKNTSKTEKQSYEVELKKWTQRDSLEATEDKPNFFPVSELSDTEDVMVYPKTIVIPPESEKIIRIIVKNRANADKDYSYRMIATQLANKELKMEKNTVHFLFQLSIPVFVQKQTVKKMDTLDIKKEIVTGEDGKKYLYLKNNDIQHVQIGAIGLNENDKTAINVYLLPGNSTKLLIPENALAEKEFKIFTDKGQSVIPVI